MTKKQKSITVKEIMEHGPCIDYPESKVRELWGKRKALTPLQICNLKIPLLDKIWVIKEFKLIPGKRQWELILHWSSELCRTNPSTEAITLEALNEIKKAVKDSDYLLYSKAQNDLRHIHYQTNDYDSLNWILYYSVPLSPDSKPSWMLYDGVEIITEWADNKDSKYGAVMRKSMLEAIKTILRWLRNNG